MEVDPLQDTVPPRHQVESDESDEDYPSAKTRKPVQRSDPNIVFDWYGAQEKRNPLIVALDEAGRQWAMGVELGEVKGRVLIDDTEVASAFRPSWAEITVVCTSLRLPVHTIHAFAGTVISTIQPTNVVIVDAYPVPSYISSSSPSFHSPIRYLRTTTASEDSSPPDAEPFRPPNLIQSPAASFLSIFESSTHATPATLLLLPSAHIPPPAPSTLEGRSGPLLKDEWELSVLVRLHTAVGAVVGVNSRWAARHSLEQFTRVRASRRGDIGEGSMYI